ncbi:MAG TPA: hypothetical protein PK563_15135, partial [Tenuifilaceae bacterium]|nr:hypothetical protein [Tenuifilaceae bacterium]
MNNTYRKFFKVLRAWWLTLMLFAFVPMTFAQQIEGIELSTPNVLPDVEFDVTIHVSDFTDGNGVDNFKYYVVYKFDANDYEKFIPFTQVGAIDSTNLTDGTGSIDITAKAPIELYTYGLGKIAVIVVNGGTSLVYQLGEPVDASGYPTGLSKCYNENFDDYDYTERSFATDYFYGLDATSTISLTLTRINDAIAIKKDVKLQYRIGKTTTAWTDFATLDLTDLNPGGSRTFNYTNASTPAIAGALLTGTDIQFQVIQTDGQTLASGVDTWEVSNFCFGNYETPAGHGYTYTFDFWIDDLVCEVSTDDVLGVPGLPDGITALTIDAPSFSITGVTDPVAGYYPGVEVTYEITSGANVKFPTATLFEVYLTHEDGGGNVIEEILVGTLPLGGTGVSTTPSTAKSFTFAMPFRPNTNNWYLNVRADMRDYTVEDSWALNPFPAINLNATLDIKATADTIRDNGVTYVKPGATLKVNYGLDAGPPVQSINTTNKDVKVVLEWKPNGVVTDWVALNTEFYPATGTRAITGVLPASDVLEDINTINLRLRMIYGTKVDVVTTYIDRFTNLDPYSGNDDMLPFYTSNVPALDTELANVPAGSKFSFHLFASNSAIQNIVVEYRYDGQGVWQQLGTSIATTATDNKFVSHHAVTTYDLVPATMEEIENAEIRIRWADGVPLGNNIGIVKGARIQGLSDEISGITASTVDVPIFHPFLTLSDNVVGEYVYADTLSNLSIRVDYNKYGLSGSYIAGVLALDGDIPKDGDDYIYLGSKAAGATNGQDSTMFTIEYTDVQELYGDHLPKEDDSFADFDLFLYATTNASPISFGTMEIDVINDIGWKDGYNAQPMAITDYIDMSGLASPLTLTLEVSDTISPLNNYTTVYFEYTKDNGVNWMPIDTLPFAEEYVIPTAWVSAQTQFRFRQPIEHGIFTVDLFKIWSGVSNLVTFSYEDDGSIPQGIDLALAADVGIDYCEDFDNADITAYEFTPDTTTVAAGDKFGFDWGFNIAKSKAPASDTVSVSDPDFYVHGLNTMEFTIDYDITSKLTEFKMTFPTGVTPAATADQSNITWEGNTMTPVTAAQVVTWTSAAGVIEGNLSIDFDVAYTVLPAVIAPFEITWSLTDADGTVTGKVEVTPATQFPEGTVFTFLVWDGAEYLEIAEVDTLGLAEATIPASLVTGAYDIEVEAEYFYEDETKALVSCGVEGPIVVYEDLFVVQPQTPEVYEIVLDEVNMIDPADKFYWEDDVEVKFSAYGPWQNLDDVRYEVVLEQHNADYVDGTVDVFAESFDAGIPGTWTIIANHAEYYSNWNDDSGAQTYAAVWYMDADPMDEWLITPSMDFTGIVDDITLSFDFASSYFWNVTVDAADIMVKVSTDGGTTWSAPLWQEDDYGVFGEFDMWRTVNVNLNAYQGAANVKIAFHYLGADGDGFMLDNVVVKKGAIVVGGHSFAHGYNMGNIPQVDNQIEYTGEFTLPSIDDIEDANDDTEFYVTVYAYHGDGSYVAKQELIAISDFYALSGTEDDETPVTFDVVDDGAPEAYRFAITEKLELAQYLGRPVYLYFDYEADIY